MASVLSKITEFVLMAILSVLAPSDQKETSCQIFRQDGQAGNAVILVRTDKGFDIFQEREGNRRPAGKIVRTDETGVLEIVGKNGKSERVDISEFVKALKPLDKNPAQTVEFQGVKFEISAQKDLIELKFEDGRGKTRFEIKPVAATSQPTSSTTQPAEK